MTRIEVRSRVGDDGVLSLRVALDPADANRDVIITVEPAGNGLDGGLTRERWAALLNETCGGWRGAPPVRPSQGSFEPRRPW